MAVQLESQPTAPAAKVHSFASLTPASSGWAQLFGFWVWSYPVPTSEHLAVRREFQVKRRQNLRPSPLQPRSFGVWRKTQAKDPAKVLSPAETESESPVTGDWTKRNENPGRSTGRIHRRKKRGEPFNEVAKELDKRRT